jgi:hypothetical protein
LIGYDLQPALPVAASRHEANAALTLRLNWQALATMEARYKVFAHLVGEGGPSDIVSQTDVYPHLPTSGWIPGEYLSDSLVLGVPDDLVPGSYSLLVGLYEPETGRRLPVFDAEGNALGDSVALEHLAVE